MVWNEMQATIYYNRKQKPQENHWFCVGQGKSENLLNPAIRGARIPELLWNQIIPIEAKAGKTGRIKSLHYFTKEKKAKLAIRVNTMPAAFHKTTETLANGEKIPLNLLSIPIYLTERLETIIESINQNPTS